MDNRPSNGVPEEFQIERSCYWQRMLNKAFCFGWLSRFRPGARLDDVLAMVQLISIGVSAHHYA